VIDLIGLLRAVDAPDTGEPLVPAGPGQPASAWSFGAFRPLLLELLQREARPDVAIPTAGSSAWPTER